MSETVLLVAEHHQECVCLLTVCTAPDVKYCSLNTFFCETPCKGLMMSIHRGSPLLFSLTIHVLLSRILHCNTTTGTYLYCLYKYIISHFCLLYTY